MLRIPPTNASTDVNTMYTKGYRCPRILKSIKMNTQIIDLNAQRRLACLVFMQWEFDANGMAKSSLGGALKERLSGFVAYFTGLLSRSKPHTLTVYYALTLLHRLRHMHPQTVGEPGCSHRLLTVALMLSYRYIEQPEDELQDCRASVEEWSRLSGGLFSAADLHRMEHEMSSFLGFDACVWMDEIEAIWLRPSLTRRTQNECIDR